MSDSWEVYVTQIDDDLAAIVFDSSHLEDFDGEAQPELILVRLKVRQPDERGWPDPSERAEMDEVEDALIPQVCEALAADYVGRITSGGHRELAFYAVNAENHQEVVKAALAPYPKYAEHQVIHITEPEWDYYHDLLVPGPLDWQLIANRRVLESLSEQGDALDTPRPVDHGLNFKTPAGRQAFVAEVTPLGFTLQETEDREVEDEDEPRFFVEVRKTMPVDLDTVDEAVLDLVEKAEKHDGEYVGWGCDVVRAEASE